MHFEDEEASAPDPDLVAEFEAIPAAVLSDVAERGRTMDAAIGPIDPGTTIAGRARTVRASPGDNLAIHRAITFVEPGDVLVVDGEGYTETAYVGEIMCASCLAHGADGMVVDGAIRDREEVARMGFPLFSRGVHPAGPEKEFEGAVDVPVSCGGVVVEPGDLVVGDADGVVVVPADDAPSALVRARERLERETELLDRVRSGEYLYEIGGYGDAGR
jgi:4-hydroxy-4-methyl-2-oxoglutarate aldolase